jgi:hypothetical protein
MAKIEDIRWGKYSSFEGPLYVAGARYQVPAQPTFEDKILATIAATEGGSWSAVNMYDVCRLTVGLIQCCEGSQYWASGLLGRLPPMDLVPLHDILQSVEVRIRSTAPNTYRFVHDRLGIVDSEPEQCRLFFAGCSGRKGEWNEAGKLWARQFCLAVARCLESESAIAAQRSYIVPKLMGFAAGELRNFILTRPDTAIGGAFACAALSFAANNPRRAKEAFTAHLSTCKADPWTMDWLVDALDMFTFLSGVTIYPHRYDAIRPVLERLFDLDLPDKSDQLHGLLSASEIQHILVHALHYDLGPGGPNGDGVDNRWGSKSKAALLDFERRNNLPSQDGMPDRTTNAALKRVRDGFANVGAKLPQGDDLSFLLAKAAMQRFDDLGIIRGQALKGISSEEEDETTDPATPTPLAQVRRSSEPPPNEES